MSETIVHVPVVYKRIPCIARVKAVFHKAIFGAPAEVVIVGGTLEEPQKNDLSLESLVDFYSSEAFKSICQRYREQISTAIVKEN